MANSYRILRKLLTAITDWCSCKNVDSNNWLQSLLKRPGTYLLRYGYKIDGLLQISAVAKKPTAKIDCRVCWRKRGQVIIYGRKYKLTFFSADWNICNNCSNSNWLLSLWRREMHDSNDTSAHENDERLHIITIWRSVYMPQVWLSISQREIQSLHML